VMVFTVGLGKDLDRQFAREWTRPSTAGFAGQSELSQEQVLAGMAERTGGRLLLSPGPNRLRRAFQEIESDLRHQYSLAYAPPAPDRAGFRRIEVRVPGRNVQVVSKEGYYAGQD